MRLRPESTTDGIARSRRDSQNLTDPGADLAHIHRVAVAAESGPVVIVAGVLIGLRNRAIIRQRVQAVAAWGAALVCVLRVCAQGGNSVSRPRLSVAHCVRGKVGSARDR